MPEDAEDVVLLAGPSEDGKGTRVLRVKAGDVSIGEVRPVEEGKPLAGDVVKLTPRKEHPRVCDVETLYAAPARKGPAKVSSSGFRANWDRVFGERRSSEPS